jgi:hypothetical protein
MQVSGAVTSFLNLFMVYLKWCQVKATEFSDKMVTTR